MIMPFIRLITIYVIVIVAVTAVFQRDRIMELAGWSFDRVPAETTETPQTAAQALAPTPVATPAPTPPPAPTTTEAAVEPVIKQPAPAAVSQPAAQTALTKQDLQTRLTQARQAYWAGDLAKSEALYAALAKDAPSNPDVKGELGNILYAQRRYGEAADAYLATGKLLVGHANPAQILPIIGVLQSIAPQKAETLRALATN